MHPPLFLPVCRAALLWEGHASRKDYVWKISASSAMACGKRFPSSPA
ncbi:hypothetical protein SAMN05216343_10597 [Oscillibacter sp. PC13]|nr:hypothetical protein SAMN05216343_10597 [Oscillibacter sp. PC13]